MIETGCTACGGTGFVEQQDFYEDGSPARSVSLFPCRCQRDIENIEFRPPGAVGAVHRSKSDIAEITRLTARVEELERAQTWQPIETAPKDGTWIMGWSENDSNPARISWGRNHNNKLAWCTAFCSFVDGYITHWTPLPRTTLSASDNEGK